MKLGIFGRRADRANKGEAAVPAPGGVPVQPTESPDSPAGKGWHTSSFELMNGVEVTEDLDVPQDDDLPPSPGADHKA